MPAHEEGNGVSEGLSERWAFPIVAKPAMPAVPWAQDRPLEAAAGRTDDNEAILPEQYVFQEYIEQSGRQYNVHLFVDRAKRIRMALVTEKCRWFPPDGGASCMCRTVHRKTYLRPV